MVGGPVTSVETVGVDPVVGGLVMISKGEGVGGLVLHISVYSQLPLKNDPAPKFWLQQLLSELYEEASAISNSLEHDDPSK